MSEYLQPYLTNLIVLVFKISAGLPDQAVLDSLLPFRTVPVLRNEELLGINSDVAHVADFAC